MEPVSPELALIDPMLAEHARARLRQPDDSLARLDALIQTSRMASLAQRSMDVSRRGAPDILRSTRRMSRIGQRRSAAFAGGIAAGVLVVALLLGVRVDLRGTPAGADTVVIDQSLIESVTRTPPRGKPALQPLTGRTARTSAPTPQRFAWAPDPGASDYHVELFRGSSKVFEADTRRPAVTVPAHWVFERRSHALEPGAYRWYVWPLVSGRQAARAIVQAKLVIPPR